MAMNPQDLMAMQGQQPNIPDPTQGEQSQIDPSSIPAQQPQPTALPDPVDALPMIILDYLDFATETRNDRALAAPVRSQVMLQIAQSINYLVPLLPKTDPNAEQDMQLKVAEFQMEQQSREHELQMKQQEHQMNMSMKQQELQFKQAESQMKLQQNAQIHQQKLVQNEQSNQQKLQQQKEAAQSKPNSKPSNKEG